MKNEVFWGLGPRGGQVWNQAGKKERFRAKGLNMFGGNFGSFSIFFAGVF